MQLAPLQPGDVVHFRVRTERRTNQRFAVKVNAVRFAGKVAAVKQAGSYGFLEHEEEEDADGAEDAAGAVTSSTTGAGVGAGRGKMRVFFHGGALHVGIKLTHNP
jgi:hypothetical protein